MEESELEEGEACSYNITNEYAGSIDPDNDLSYIDEKLQHILGHFQKDFEGGVSAENLGMLMLWQKLFFLVGPQSVKLVL
jgi:hypothetical protein